MVTAPPTSYNTAVDIPGTAAITTIPTMSAAMYGQIAPMASSGDTLPMRQAM